MLIVIWRNKLWELDMPWRLYQSLKLRHPETIVKLEELTQSMYKEQKSVPIRETEDWTIFRNRMAVGLS